MVFFCFFLFPVGRSVEREGEREREQPERRQDKPQKKKKENAVAFSTCLPSGMHLLDVTSSLVAREPALWHVRIFPPAMCRTLSKEARTVKVLVAYKRRPAQILSTPTAAAILSPGRR